MTDKMVTETSSTPTINQFKYPSSSIILVPHGRRDFVKLDFTIADASGHSSNYHADHILDDHPTDQSSRWSSLTNDQNQFLLLRLERPALVRTVTFGKFFKTHVCNLKEFRVLAGSTADHLFEVIHSGKSP